MSDRTLATTANSRPCWPARAAITCALKLTTLASLATLWMSSTMPASSFIMASERSLATSSNAVVAVLSASRMRSVWSTSSAVVEVRRGLAASIWSSALRTSCMKACTTGPTPRVPW